MADILTAEEWRQIENDMREANEARKNNLYHKGIYVSKKDLEGINELINLGITFKDAADIYFDAELKERKKEKNYLEFEFENEIKEKPKIYIEEEEKEKDKKTITEQILSDDIFNINLYDLINEPFFGNFFKILNGTFYYPRVLYDAFNKKIMLTSGENQRCLLNALFYNGENINDLNDFIMNLIILIIKKGIMIHILNEEQKKNLSRKNELIFESIDPTNKKKYDIYVLKNNSFMYFNESDLNLYLNEIYESKKHQLIHDQIVPFIALAFDICIEVYISNDHKLKYNENALNKINFPKILLNNHHYSSIVFN